MEAGLVCHSKTFCNHSSPRVSGAGDQVISIVSSKSRAIGFGHAELNISDADTTEIAQLYREYIPVL